VDPVLRHDRARPSRHRRSRCVLWIDGGAHPEQPHRAWPEGGLGAHGVLPRALLGRLDPAPGEQRLTGLLLVLHEGRRRSLDDVFNALKRRSWNAPNASYYLQGRGYTERDVERAASEIAGEDLHAWFERHVGGTEDVDYDAELARAGLRLVRGGDVWRLEELPEATPAQRVVREGWITGRRG